MTQEPSVETSIALLTQEVHNLTAAVKRLEEDMKVLRAAYTKAGGAIWMLGGLGVVAGTIITFWSGIKAFAKMLVE